MLNDPSSLPSYLASRRSSRPRDLVAPGPDATQLDAILTIAARTPDHGKLAPWRFVVVASDRRDAFAAMLTAAYRGEKPNAGRVEIDAVDAFAHQAPCLVVVLSTPDTASRIPLWEQQLSCGAAAMNLIHGAHAHGFAAGWVTGWASFNAAVAASLGAGPDDRIAGFVFIGSPGESPAERIRPALADVVSHWSPRP
ncbi:MAG: nitroreductase [Sphingomonadales bacterium]|nr:nitroreductase [Sphingomonadales bacterium]